MRDQPLVFAGAIDELLADGVPLEVLVVVVGEVDEGTNGGGAVAGFDVADRRFAGAHGGYPVAEVILTVIQTDGIRGQELFEHGFAIADVFSFLFSANPDGEFAAVDIDSAFFSDEGDAVAAGVAKFDAGGVANYDAGRNAGFSGRDDFGGTRFIESEAPLGDVEVVSAPVGDAATAVFAVVAPVWEVVVNAARTENGVVGAFGCGAEPEVPVEAGFKWFFGEIAELAGAADADIDILDFADAAVADEFAGGAEFAGGTLHGAELKDALIAANGVNHGAAFRDGVSHGLLTVDIFPGVGGGDGDEGMPVVRGGDNDCIDVFVLKDLPEICIGRTFFIGARGFFCFVVDLDSLFGVVPTGGVNVANG